MPLALQTNMTAPSTSPSPVRWSPTSRRAPTRSTLRGDIYATFPPPRAVPTALRGRENEHDLGTVGTFQGRPVSRDGPLPALALLPDADDDFLVLPGLPRTDPEGPARMNAGLQTIMRMILPVLLALTLVAEAQAGDTPPELFPAAVPGEAKALPAQTTARSDWSSAIIFVNRATTPRTVRIERFASGPTGTFDVTIARRGKDGATTQLPKGALVPLDAGTTLDLVASATLAKPGAYTIFVRLLDEQNVELSNAALTVTRASDMLPSEGIVTSPVPTRFFSGTRTADLSIELDGLQTRPLDFVIRNLRVIRVNDGGESDSGLVPGIGMACDGAEAQLGQPYSISENGRCTLSLKVTDFDAGDYRVRFDLAGTGGGARAVDLPFKARTGSGRFILLLIAGGVLGGFLSWWRDTEQPRTLRSARHSDPPGTGHQRDPARRRPAAGAPGAGPAGAAHPHR